MKKEVLKVKGMACNGCENRIKNRLNNIEGINSVSADYRVGDVSVEYNEDKVSIDLIKENIEDLGFEV